MKKTYSPLSIFKLMLFLLLLPSLTFAQEARIKYTEQIQIPENVKDLEPNIRAAVEAQLKQQGKTKYLYYNRGISLYMADDEVESGNNVNATQSNIQIKTLGGDAVVYKNHESKEMICQEYILDRKFLIDEKLETSAWNLEAEEKTIGNFKCKKASNGDGDIAWYCPDIPISDGPLIYYGLPGLIIEMETKTQTITAEEINTKYDTSAKIKKPDSGKSVSREEYKETFKKKMAEMGVDGGSSGVKVIKMQ